MKYNIACRKKGEYRKEMTQKTESDYDQIIRILKNHELYAQEDIRKAIINLLERWNVVSDNDIEELRQTGLDIEALAVNRYIPYMFQKSIDNHMNLVTSYTEKKNRKVEIDYGKVKQTRDKIEDVRLLRESIEERITRECMSTQGREFKPFTHLVEIGETSPLHNTYPEGYVLVSSDKNKKVYTNEIPVRVTIPSGDMKTKFNSLFGISIEIADDFEKEAVHL